MLSKHGIEFFDKKESNADKIMGNLQMKTDKASILAELSQRKAKEKPD